MKIFLLIINFLYLVRAEDVIVTLPNGKIRGSAYSTYRRNMKFYGFIGIPYAAPPVGKLRFMPPQPVSNWTGILETKSCSKICYQVQRKSAGETEDCLYLSIYTPAKPGSDAKLPVAVRIYGGAFIHGNQMTNVLEPQYVVEENIVVVSFNYRIGPFGFLSTGDEVISGNMGLKDQHFALEWVQKNIALFGGDPKKVTLIGQSAGAASVTYHILSSKSKGLFRAAIAQSASALCNWAYQSDPASRAYGIANEIDKHFSRKNSTTNLLEFLQSVEASQIDDTGDKYHAFAPVIEKNHPNAIITASMYESVSKGEINRVPLIIGINSEEEISKIADPNSLRLLVKRYDNAINLLVPGSMNINSSGVAATVGRKIREIYTEGLLQNNLTASVKYFSDNQYNRPTIRYAELQSQHSDVYFYQFSYHGVLARNNLTLDGVHGVNHAEDQHYFWTYYKSLSPFPASDVKTIERYVGLLTNLIKTLNPNTGEFKNLNWPKVTKSVFHYLDIGNELIVKTDPKDPFYKKWLILYNTYGVKPFIYF